MCMHVADGLQANWMSASSLAWLAACDTLLNRDVSHSCRCGVLCRSGHGHAGGTCCSSGGAAQRAHGVSWRSVFLNNFVAR